MFDNIHKVYTGNDIIPYFVDKQWPHGVRHFFCFDTSQCQFPHMSQGGWGLCLTSAQKQLGVSVVPSRHNFLGQQVVIEHGATYKLCNGEKGIFT